MNYRWLPELTIPFAFRIVKLAEIKDHESILDYGAAKGYLLYALRLLGFECYGCDISEYAISKSHKEIESYNKLITSNHIPFEHDFDWIIAKDVLEHIPYERIDSLLEHFTEKTKKCFFIIPLGNGKNFHITEYENDITHIIREETDWWIDKFSKNGFEVLKWSYDVSKVKESWKHYRNGNAFFILKSRFIS